MPVFITEIVLTSRKSCSWQNYWLIKLSNLIVKQNWLLRLTRIIIRNQSDVGPVCGDYCDVLMTKWRITEGLSCGQPRLNISVEGIIERYSKMIWDGSLIIRWSCLIRICLVPWLCFMKCTKKQIIYNLKQLILKLNRMCLCFIGDYFSFYCSHVVLFWPDNDRIKQDD